MSRKTKSLEELALSGALAARPGRYKSRITAATGHNAKIPAESLPLGSAPTWFDSDHKKVWRELARSYPNLTHKDRTFLEIAVKLSYRMRTATLKSQETTQLLSILARFDGQSVDAPVSVTVVDTRSQYDRDLEEAFAEWDAQDAEDREIRKEMQVTGKTYYQIQQEREARTRNE